MLCIHKIKHNFVISPYNSQKVLNHTLLFFPLLFVKLTLKWLVIYVYHECWSTVKKYFTDITSVLQNGTNAGPYSHVADFSAVRELDQISKEIDDIKK